MFTRIFWRFLILETFVMSALGKTCPHFFVLQHPQIQYCSNQLVLRANISEGYTMGGYRIEVLKVYKGSLKNVNIMSNGMRTVKTDRILPLEYGTEVIIFGNARNGDIHVTSCNGIKQWPFLTPFQRTHIKKYGRGCACIDKIGTFTLRKLCYFKASIMRKVGGNCTWDETDHVKKCEETYKSLIHYHSP